VKLLYFFFLISCNPNSIKETKLPLSFEAKVIGIKDGDTIEVLYDKKSIILRLAHIDCPEIRKHQPFGWAAKKFTSDMCFMQVVQVENNGKLDTYKRLIAVITNGKSKNVNKELVKAGLAWHFLKYSKDKTYHELEAIARQNKIGLWADENPIPPWNWRKPKKLK